MLSSFVLNDSGIVEHFAVAVAENVGRVPPLDAEQTSLETGRDDRLDQRLSGLEILPRERRTSRRRKLDECGDVGAEVRRRIRVGNPFLDRRIRVDHARRNAVVVRLECLFRTPPDARMRGRLGQEDLGAPAPHHHQPIAVVLLLEPAHILAQLIGEFFLVLPLFDVGSIEPLDVPAIEHRRHRLDRFELGTNLFEQCSASSTPAVFAASYEFSSKMSHAPNTTSSSDDSGTKSLISGERPSVRFPRRTVPIWVNDPIGGASPRRTAMTPAIVVVLTAPRPTSRMPELAACYINLRRIFHNRKLYHLKLHAMVAAS